MSGAGAAGPAALAAALLAGSLGLARAADAARDPAARAAEGAPPLGAATVLAVDLLWLRADALFAGDRWPEMLAAYEAAGRVAPRLSASWEFRGFHLAYNLAGAAAEGEDRDRWVLEGVRVLEEGLRRNPEARDLRAYLARTLFDRSERWPVVRAALRRARGREPLDEAVDLLAGLVAADPGDGSAVLWLVDALIARGRRTLDAAAPGTPAAAADFRRAAEALRAWAPRAAPDGARAAETMARGADGLVRAAETSDAAERARILREVDAPAPAEDGGKDGK